MIIYVDWEEQEIYTEEEFEKKIDEIFEWALYNFYNEDNSRIYNLNSFSTFIENNYSTPQIFNFDEEDKSKILDYYKNYLVQNLSSGSDAPFEKIMKVWRI